MKKVMPCDLQDYVEIACMFHYQIELELHSGKCILGKALNTIIEDKVECLIIEGRAEQASDRVSIEQKVALSELKVMRVLSKNARFDSIEF